MNDAMYAHEATGRNIAALAARGWAFVGPEVGALAEGPSDRPGRMSEPDTILAHAERLLGAGSRLAGRTVLVTAGPTREPIDPVRVVTNRSSGKMGYRLAEAAWARGATVVLVSGPTTLQPPIGVRLRSVETTRDLEAAVAEELPRRRRADHGRRAGRFPACHAQRRQAARAPTARSPSRWSRPPTSSGPPPRRARPAASSSGFALETGDAIQKARAKLQSKALDLIVVNDALEPGAGFDVDTNRVAILDRDGNARVVPLASKREVAEAILDAVEERLG